MYEYGSLAATLMSKCKIATYGNKNSTEWGISPVLACCHKTELSQKIHGKVYATKSNTYVLLLSHLIPGDNQLDREQQTLPSKEAANPISSYRE